MKYYTTLSEYITSLTEEYIKEAKSSPNALEDMAQLEKYLSESYNERAIAELIQNADDAQAKRLYVEYKNNNLYVANDGLPFSQTDVASICRSGKSNKIRGQSIGYRGVGFKSTTCFSEQIIISSNDCLFSFSRKIAAEKLHISQSQIPIVRIPFLLQKESLSPQTFDDIVEIKRQGFTTVFTFVNANFNMVKKELDQIKPIFLLFINNIMRLEIRESINHTLFERTKISPNSSDINVVLSGNGNYSEYQMLYGNNNISIAIPISDDLSFSGDNAGYFFTYLPTTDSTQMFIHINGDFSTDPSRRNIVIDDHKKTKNEKQKYERTTPLFLTINGKKINRQQLFYSLKPRLEAVGLTDGIKAIRNKSIK